MFWELSFFESLVGRHLVIATRMDYLRGLGVSSVGLLERFFLWIDVGVTGFFSVRQDGSFTGTKSVTSI